MAQVKAFLLGGIGGGSNPCCCSPTDCEVTICLHGCGGAAAKNVTVTIKSGATVITSGVTGSNGCVTLTIPAAGVYTIVTSGQPRYGVFSGARTLSCNGNVSLSLSPASGYVCSPCFNEPIPTTLNYTADGISGSFAYSSTVGLCLTKNISGVMTPFGGGDCSGTTTTNPCTIGTSDVCAQISLFFNSVPPTGGPPICGGQEAWNVSTDCDQTVAPTINPTNYPYYLFTACPTCPAISNGIFIPQWLEVGVACRGYAGHPNASLITYSSPQNVPVNITLTFPNALGGFVPLFSAITITE